MYYGEYHVLARPITITNINAQHLSYTYGDTSSTIQTALGSPYDCLGFAANSQFDALANADTFQSIFNVSFNTSFDGTGTAVALSDINSTTPAGNYYIVLTPKDNNVSIRYAITYSFVETTSYVEVARREVGQANLSHFCTYYYSGESRNPEFTFKWNGNDITFTASGEYEETNAGTYTATITATGNYVGTATLEWEISKTQLWISTNNVQVQYGDAVPQYSFIAEELLGDDTIADLDLTNVQYTCTYTTASNVGSYPITVSGIASNNYLIEYYQTGSVVVSPRPVTLENVTNLSTQTYTGASITPTYDFKWNNTNITCTASGDTSAIYPGDYTLTLKAIGNYSGTVNVEWSIAKKTVTYTWGTSAFTYDGQPHIPTLEVAGLIAADEITVNVLSPKTNAGNYTATVILSGVSLGNYTLPQVNTQAFTIAKATQTIDVSGIVTSKPYTGSTITFEGATSSYAGSMITYANNAHKNVGTYTMTVYASESTNYAQASTTLDVTITEAEPVADDTGAKEYDKDVVVDQDGNAKDVDITSIIKKAAADNASTSVKIKVGDNESIVFDKNAIAAIASADNVKISVETKKGDAASNAVAGSVMVFEITLTGATFENGTATFSAPFNEEVPSGKIVKVYYVDANGNRTDMNARFEDGLVIFGTNHFSTYAVVYEDAPKAGLSGGAIAGIVIAIVVVLGAAGFCVYWFVFRKKKGNKPVQEESKEEPAQEESAEEQEEEAQEESVEETPTQEEKSEEAEETAEEDKE